VLYDFLWFNFGAGILERICTRSELDDIRSFKRNTPPSLWDIQFVKLTMYSSCGCKFPWRLLPYWQDDLPEPFDIIDSWPTVRILNSRLVALSPARQLPWKSNPMTPSTTWRPRPKTKRQSYTSLRPLGACVSCKWFLTLKYIQWRFY